MSTEAPGQVLCGASSHPPGADKVHSPAHVLWKQLVDFSSWCPICLFVNTRDFFNVFPFFLDQNLYSSWPAYYSNISCTCPAVRSKCGRKQRHHHWAPIAQSDHFVSSALECPVVTSCLSLSGVTIGHFGEAPQRKCDPAALTFFFSSVTHPQRPWGRTSVTGPIQLQITFVLRPFLFEQRDRPLFQIRADVTAGQGLWRLVFSVFVFTSRSQHYDSPWRFFISALKVLHDFYVEYFRATASDTPWQFMFLS